LRVVACDIKDILLAFPFRERIQKEISQVFSFVKHAKFWEITFITSFRDTKFFAKMETLRQEMWSLGETMRSSPPPPSKNSFQMCRHTARLSG
jgi:hypothetical protein